VSALATSDPRGIYVNDPAYFGLDRKVQTALRRGQVTPMEARYLRDVAAIGWRPGEIYWLDAMRKAVR
jgi:hypothetical protein